jgi:hypothetical protein
MGFVTVGKESSAGFAVSTYSQDLIEENANERFSERYGDSQARNKALREGLIRPGSATSVAITQKGWDLLNKDVLQLERNAMEWLNKVFNRARDEGHDSREDLVGTFWFDPTKVQHAMPIYLASDWGASERIDMTDASYGSLARTAFKSVSAFGSQILGGQIDFFAVGAEDQAWIERTLEQHRERTRRRA